MRKDGSFYDGYEFETLSLDEEFGFWAEFVQPSPKTLDARCVHPSSRAVLDYPYSPEAATNHDYAVDNASSRDDGGVPLAYSTVSFDPIWRVRTVTRVIEEVNPQGVPSPKRVAQFGVRQASLTELLVALRAANLEVEQICGDFSRSPLTSSSPRLIAICSRSEPSDGW